MDFLFRLFFVLSFINRLMIMLDKDYLKINKESWNKRAEVHYESDFYDNEGFIKGRNSLNSIELELLPELQGKSVLHLQCHFGQDTISLNRMGAEVTGVDLSDKSIELARDLAKETSSSAKFICCDIYDLPNYLDQQFDVVFTSYGTIGWLPDLDKWAAIVSKYLKPGGQFVFAEFHPVVWMFDDDFKEIKYRYFKSEPIIEESEGSYTENAKSISQDYISWNHGLAEVITALINSGLQIKKLREYDYSPYNCFNQTVEVEKNKFRIKHLNNSLPMVYSLMATKKMI